MVIKKSFVTRLFRGCELKTGRTICITDDYSKAVDIMTYHNKDYSIAEIKPIYDCDEFDIIENDDNKEYGFSECFQKEGSGTDITMFKHRLIMRNNMSYEEAVTELTENTGTWNDGLSVQSAVNAHVCYWLKSKDMIDENTAIPCFAISNEDMKILLKTGFTAHRFLHAQGEFNPTLNTEKHIICEYDNDWYIEEKNGKLMWHECQSDTEEEVEEVFRLNTGEYEDKDISELEEIGSEHAVFDICGELDNLSAFVFWRIVTDTNNTNEK